MSKTNIAYQYFLIHTQIPYEEALDASEKALNGIDPLRYYIHAILLQLFHDDDIKNPTYVDIIKTGEKTGCPLSGMLLAILLQQGRVIEKHPAQAYAYYEKHIKSLEELAYSGEAMAQSMLGLLNQAGLFVKKDIETAMRYYHQAQKQGLRIAYHQLGLLYKQKGPYYDEKKAEHYFNVSLNDQYVSSLFIKGLQSMKEKNDEETIYYLTQAASLDYHHAMFSLGSFYMTKKQPEKAFELFLKASELGHLKATYMVALAYASGRGVTKDSQLAEGYLKHAANKGDMLSAYQLAALYMKKKPRPYIDIYDYLMVAAKKKHPLAIHNLGVMFLQGDGVMKDVKQALQFFEQGAHLGVPISLFHAAKIFLEGVYVPKNEQKAMNYLQLAAKKKFKPAIELLETLNRKSSSNASYVA